MTEIELRSDTLTLPTDSMRDSMRDAVVGDDVCDEDPTVIELQRYCADLCGTEASLFVPSGTFGNQCAIGTHLRSGDEIIISETTHVIIHEGAASAALWGAQTRTISPSTHTYLTSDQIRTRLREGYDVHTPETALIVLENALADGTVMPLAEMKKVRDTALAHHVPIHLDGARLFNAALALGVEAAEIVSHVDSVMFCLSKGLGAPVGSMLCGTEPFIHRAKKKRKLMGGGMRQVGVLAAPAMLAMTEGRARLAEDHSNARLLGDLFAAVDGIQIDLETVQTNMVFIKVAKHGKTDEGLVDHLNTQGVRTYPPSYWGLRFVTSSRVCEADVRACASATATYMDS